MICLTGKMFNKLKYTHLNVVKFERIYYNARSLKLSHKLVFNLCEFKVTAYGILLLKV